MKRLDDAALEIVLRWSLIERGTAELSDALGPDTIVASPPRDVMPADVAVAGRTQLFRRQRPPDASRTRSSFDVVRDTVVPGAVVLVQCDPTIGAAFGSNIALQAAACRAQAIVTDGTFRDRRRLREVGIPVAGNGTAPTRPTGCPMVVTDTVDMFGVTWRNDDWLLRDVDGMLRLDAAQAQRVAGEACASAAGELAALVSGSGAGQ